MDGLLRSTYEMKLIIKAFAILTTFALILAFAAPLSAAPAAKTKICHFSGHWAYLGEPYNYAVFDSELIGDGTACLEMGGKILELPDKALGGHQVDADVLFPGQFEKCIICHYPSHVAADDALYPDWIDSVLTRGAGGACFLNGGMVIVTSCSAIDGHKAFCFPDAPDWPNCPYNAAP